MRVLSTELFTSPTLADDRMFFLYNAVCTEAVADAADPSGLSRTLVVSLCVFDCSFLLIHVILFERCCHCFVLPPS